MPSPADTVSYNVAANLLRLRLSRGWSVERLAEEVGQSFAVVEQAERGVTRVEPEALAALAGAFGVTAEELQTPPADLAQRCTDPLEQDAAAPGFQDAVTRARQDAVRLGFSAVAARAANLEAEIRYQRGDTEAAIRLALATLTRFRIYSEEDRMGLLWTLGRGWLVTDRTDVAGLVFAALVQELPTGQEDWVRALINLGTCYRVGGWYREAADVYRQVLDTAAATAEVRAWAGVGLAGCLPYLDREGEAAALLKTVSEEASRLAVPALQHSVRLLELVLEARRLTPAAYRDVFRRHLADEHDMLRRAQLMETWADLETRHGEWAAAFQAAEDGLSAVRQVGSTPCKLVKARLLWWRGLARERLGQGGVDLDREWAQDLLAAEGAPPDYVERYLVVPDGLTV